MCSQFLQRTFVNNNIEKKSPSHPQINDTTAGIEPKRLCLLYLLWQQLHSVRLEYPHPSIYLIYTDAVLSYVSVLSLTPRASYVCVTNELLSPTVYDVFSCIRIVYTTTDISIFAVRLIVPIWMHTEYIIAWCSWVWRWMQR